ncbi:MAG: rRNA maturation RNase YbeY [Kiritimatiellae bacterium]|nr:rRNA maturation RNase YbeY [Kiritimatiellia bacterium]
MKKLADFFFTKLQRISSKEWDEISVVIVNNIQSQEINKIHLQHDYPTDVITYTLPPFPGEDTFSGEIIVNVEYAFDHFKKSFTFQKELALYIAHGFDHLSGANDASEIEYNRMRRRELRWLSEAQKLNLL